MEKTVSKEKSLKEAKKWLAMARKRASCGVVSDEVSLLRGCIKKAKSSLDKIGTSEEELEELIKKSFFRKLKNA
jgi:hypothetical protein